MYLDDGQAIIHTARYHIQQKIQHLQNTSLISKLGWFMKRAISYTDEGA